MIQVVLVYCSLLFKGKGKTIDNSDIHNIFDSRNNINEL